MSVCEVIYNSSFTTISTSTTTTTSSDINFSTSWDIILKSNPRAPRPGCAVTFRSSVVRCLKTPVLKIELNVITGTLIFQLGTN